MLTGRVTGTVARIVAQEGVPEAFASARVTFLARVGEFSAGTDLVIPDRVTCRLDAQGRILDPTDPEGVRLGVELAASENVEGGFSTVVRVEGPSFTTRVFDIIVRSGETIDIATAVHVPAQPGQVVDRLADLVDQVQEWVDDPTTLPDVGPAVEAAAGSASAAADSAQQAHESAVAAAGSAGDAHSDRVAAEAAAQAAAGSASTATTAAETATTMAGQTTALQDAAVSALVGEPGSLTRLSLARVPRRFVVFGDSWTTTLDGVNIPETAINLLGGQLIANYGIAGAQIAPSNMNDGKSTGAQVTAASADTSFDKTTITDVIVLAGVNNIGGYQPTVSEGFSLFSAMRLYPNSRYWYVANSMKGINASNNNAWKWYNRFFESASLAGYAVAIWSPMWNWGENRSSWWAEDSVDTNRHMIAAGQTAWANRLAGFLSGQSWEPHFKIAIALDANATALASGAAIGIDNSTIDGSVLHLAVIITGMGSLTGLAGTGWQKVAQIPTGYAPTGDYMYYPAGTRLSTGQANFEYGFRVAAMTGTVEVDERVLKENTGFFTLEAAIPLRLTKV